MDYGRYGRELLLDLKRSNAAYNDTTVSACIQDLNLHVRALQEQVAANEGQEKVSMNVRPSILLQQEAIYRNKRCLLTYHWIRLQEIQDRYWSHQQNSPDEATPLGPAEDDFIENYKRLHESYIENSMLPVDDLRSHSGLPPLNSDRVLVRVVSVPTEGSVMLASGVTVDFKVGATHFLPWNDVEEWVRQGNLHVLTGEEHNDS